MVETTGVRSTVPGINVHRGISSDVTGVLREDYSEPSGQMPVDVTAESAMSVSGSRNLTF